MNRVGRILLSNSARIGSSSAAGFVGRSTTSTFTPSSSSSSSSSSTSLLLSNFKVEQKRYYHERVLDHYNNPRNIGSFDKNLPDVGTATVGAPACGDVMKIQIKVKENIIVDVCFKTFGCGSAIASSSLATEWVKGKTLDQCLEIRNTDIAKHLSLPPVKMHCSMLAEQAIKRAIYDYKVKLEKQQANGEGIPKEKVIETTL
ncbi:hypothetical protein DFA_01322 [Cavenderia fasciculata]|uniref:Iron-sulfur cluster assembly protein n=1 Tax=Cavenderia fasciculata TaxID=261658 RepID=F4PS55_CACFS|nr:uncharacterized protein DFA_01322 [Cavenderia fasciculata]EGG21438.1 hypothetical protein DFA_01322 [Cavenderia fasciculata]|eukprot:XP_004359288.1 hypothetical protein DFA_01322 [Cavenderia fasciculata]